MVEQSKGDVYDFYDAEDFDERACSPLSKPHFEYRDEAIPLITYNSENGKFDMNETAASFLRSLSSPLAVVTVAGMYRTGKSYLLNRVLLDRKDGFGVGPTVNPCTKGLWVWGRPISGVTPEGDSCSVIIVDTEGIGALDEDSDHDSRVFSLAILIASFFVYNSVGSIDENALSNLSLVVNLTKHIHIRSQQAPGEEPDCEDYAAYFPSFMWVVRDFTLQLVDTEGEPMTPKEYLERALNPQKGFTDSVEEKNRIRRLLKNFFKERECFTMVRPTTNEGDLQRLASKELSDLRSEFVEQVHSLRRRVLGRIRPKTLNGKLLSGDMLTDLVQSYVVAINTGAAPSIESAWSYICKNECRKALQEAEDLYNKIINSSLSHRLPISEEELKLLHREAKEAALDQCHHKALGEDKQESLRLLNQMISERFSHIKADNEAECQRGCEEFLEENYSIIERQLKNGEFATFADYSAKMRAFMDFFNKHGPEGPYRREILLEFCQLKSALAAESFLTEVNKELELQTVMSSEHLTRVEGELRDIKEDYLKDKDNWQRKLTVAESERAEMSASEQVLRAQVLSLKEERDRIERELRESAKAVRAESQRQIEEASSKIWDYEDKVKKAERIAFEAKNEFEREKALLVQQIKFLQDQLDEFKSKDKDMLTEIKNQKRDYSSTLKELHTKHEEQLKKYQVRLEYETEKQNELERLLNESGSTLERERAKWEDSEFMLNSQLRQIKSEVESLTERLRSKEQESASKVEEFSKEQETVLTKIKTRLEETERKLKLTEDTYKTEQATWSKDSALLTQKADFLDQQLAEVKANLDEERRAHEATLKAISTANDEAGRADLEAQLQSIREQHIIDIRKKEYETEHLRKKLGKEAEDLREKLTEMELQRKLDANDWKYQEKQFTDQVASLNEERTRFQEKLKAMQAEKAAMSAQNIERMTKREKSLESLLEETKLRCAEEVAEANEKAETSLSQLKAYYEQEKVRLEQRLIDEKSRAERRYANMVEEYEAKLREESEAHEDEIANMQDEFRDIEAQNIQEINVLTHQASLDCQKIETQERYIVELKENLKNLGEAHSATIEQQLEGFSKERSSFLEKLERMRSELGLKERELSVLINQKETLERDRESREKELEELKAQHTKDKTMLLERLEDTKQKNQKLGDVIAQKNSEFKRELALANQHIEFQSKKIADLENSLNSATQRYNEAMKTLKDESVQELNATIEKLTADKESLEKKMEMKKNAFKDLETRTSKQITLLEKERAVLQEKNMNLEAKSADMQERLSQDIATLQAQLKDKISSESADRQTLLTENEKLKVTIQEIERELSDKGSNYDRDRVLWESKFSFLAQQKDQARLELQEAQKKYEQTIDQLRKRSNAEKERLESTSQALLAQVDARHANQVKELTDSYNAELAELKEKNRMVERELRNLREELELERRVRNCDSGTIEKRLIEMQENEQRLHDEIDNLKKDRDRKINEQIEQFQSDKENLRVKLADYEKRTKEAEASKSALFLEHEKEKARWSLEKDHLISQKNEIQDALEHAERRKENLLRENEKMKADRGSRARNAGTVQRRETNTSRGSGSNILTGSITFEDFTREKSRDSGGANTPKSTAPSDNSPKPERRVYAVRGPSPMSRDKKSISMLRQEQKEDS
mmetsp:Transcript_19811/g.36576  ORF Transcript_19811/g.36576 Transcript_19811/m.36576 type:complete len:1656 (+) Transcript_19811:4704-9671(+)